MRSPTGHAVQVSAEGAAHPHAHLQVCKLIERRSSLRNALSALASGLAAHRTCASVGRCGHAHTWGSPAALTAASASENACLRRQHARAGHVRRTSQETQGKSVEHRTTSGCVQSGRTRLPRGRDGFTPQGLFFMLFCPIPLSQNTSATGLDGPTALLACSALAPGAR